MNTGQQILKHKRLCDEILGRGRCEQVFRSHFQPLSAYTWRDIEAFFVELYHYLKENNIETS